MSNLLKNQTSPYLLQHAENPVHWYPWGAEAFEKARKENKPIFLSIGYSTCHWCHVMAHESFENSETADILNKDFVSIKVDREERPDIDSVYMSVCQAFTGSGGWPMSIFMTWDKKPFFAGTYFPPHRKYGMPAFSEVLSAIANQWKADKEVLLKSADEMIEELKNAENIRNSSGNNDLTKDAIEFFTHSFDSKNGGFGSAPKFPTPHNLLFLMLYSIQNNNLNTMKMAEKTLQQMRKGGIFDHVGYGFSRYSTDKYYLAPHFEKMLYDNALLIIAYACAYSITDSKIYLDTAEKTAEYILCEMTSVQGGFYSAQDADSEGVEGKYYTYSLNEITDVLGDESAGKFAETFDVTERGNFEGKNILNLLRSNDLNTQYKDEIKKLYSYRKTRYSLHLDDKILLSWNSMTVAAFSILYRIVQNEKYLAAAQKSLNFIEKNLCNNMLLYTSFRDGKCSEHGFLDDYAYYTAALIEMYNSTLDTAYLERAEAFCNEAVKRFADSENSGFYLSRADNSDLIINPKETYDGAVPSGNSVMAYNFVRLYQITENDMYRELAEKQIEYMSGRAHEYPAGHCMFLLSLLLFENPPKHITVSLKDENELSEIRKKLTLLSNVKVVSDNSEYPLLNNQTTYYVCENSSCFPPVNKLE